MWKKYQAELNRLPESGRQPAAFVGVAEKGVIGKAIRITNWTEFKNEFGGFLSNRYLAYGVYGFFAEGGTSCYVVRTCHYQTSALSTRPTAILSSLTLYDGTKTPPVETTKSLNVTASSEGAWANNLSIRVEAASEGTGFKLTVYAGDPEIKENELESFDQLTMDRVEEIINNKSKFIRVKKVRGWWTTNQS